MTGRQEAGTDGPIGRARDLAAAGRLTEAIAAFGRILAAQPGRLDALTGLAEAACVLGVPAGTAKWRLSEIRKALRRAWEREYGQTI